MKRFSENGARPVASLGGLTTPPCIRLGALVFQLNNTDSLYWASLSAPTRIAGCALGHCPMDTRWENVSPERRSANWFTSSGPTKPKALPVPWEPTDNRTISFSLGTVFAEPTPKTPGSSINSCRERMHPQSTDGLSAQVALLQSPILSAAGKHYHFPNPTAKPTKTMT